MDSLSPSCVFKEMNDSGCVQDEPIPESYKGQAELMDLSDDVLLCILQLCSPRDLKALGHTCSRLGALICDRTLWIKVDARSHTTGQERMRWYLEHCLSAATQELKLKGYVNRETRCLGVQDLSFNQNEAGPGMMRSLSDRGLLGMWYPHLPRYAMSPRWPDKREAAGKSYSKDTKNKPHNAHLYPLSQLASQIVVGNGSGPSTNSSESKETETNPSKAATNSNAVLKSSNTISDSSNSDSISSNIASDSKNAVSDMSNAISDSSNVASTESNTISETSTAVSKNDSVLFLNNSPSTSNINSNPNNVSNEELCAMEVSPSNKNREAIDNEPKSSTVASNSSNVAANSSDSALCSNSISKRDAATSPIADNFGLSSDVSNSSNTASNLSNVASNLSNVASSSSKINSESSTSGWSASPASNSSTVREALEEPATPICHGPQFTFDEMILKKLRRKCCNLTSLALEYCNLDYKTTNLSFFPRELKKLSLRGTRCYNLPLNASFLGKIQDRLPELEYLDISECEWFEPASLLSLSKLPNLKELYMKECRRLTECVAYASLATRYGFQKLKVLDVRGSMVADSEVSAFGWLPLLEELYVSPPEDFKNFTEHTHKWEDVLASVSELEQWEIDEPDYYVCRSSSMEPMDEDEDPKEQREGISEERLGDVIMDNYLACASLASRIIVIQPNRNQNQNREPEVVPPEAVRLPAADIEPEPQPQGRPEHLAPQAGPLNDQPGPSNDQPGPSNDQPGLQNENISPRAPKRPNTDTINVLDLIKRSRLDNNTEEPNNRPASGDNRKTASSDNQAGPSQNPNPQDVLNLVKSAPSGKEANISQARQEQPRPNVFRNPIFGQQNQEGFVRIGNRLPVVVQAYPNNDQDPLRALAFEIRRARARHEHPIVIPIPPHPNFNPEYMDYGQDRPQEGQENPEADLDQIYENLRRNSRRLLEQEGQAQRRRIPFPAILREAQPVVQIDIDVHRGNVPQSVPLFGYHLVTDSAVLRFGRADNETINYVHIGHFQPNERGVRPDRSNLRILSITGFRSITNRSLEHLATAAPYLRRIDFSQTGVTARGVELFKAIRPDCEVIFSEFGQSG